MKTREEYEADLHEVRRHLVFLRARLILSVITHENPARLTQLISLSKARQVELERILFK